ncbi:MAG: DUF2029 domain-containing protein [Acidimicrobiia bacterium]|nr:DUF2029 domain-containing protein [Acidimicrobiia bacterium]
MKSQSDQATSAQWRLKMYPLAVLVAMAVGLVVLGLQANDSEAPAQTVGGDFPAFYGAGVIAADGDWENLYDFERQAEAQADLQEEAGTVRYFAYPPQVAAAHAPLAAFDYGTAYLIYTALMFGMLVLAIKLAEPMLPWLRGRTVLASAIALSFWPMLRAVTGGSNTALSLLLVVAGWRLIHDDRHFGAGLVLAGLLFKPQLAVPLIGLMLIVRLYRVVAGASAGAVVFYLSGVPFGGASWPVDWWETARAFNVIDSEVNGYSSVSWLGFLENALGVGEIVPVALGWGLAIATVLGLVWLWHRNGAQRLPELLAVAMPGILLLSPHALSHDTAILLLTFAVLHRAASLPRWLIAASWTLAAAQVFIRALGFSPGFFLLLLVTWFTVTTLGLVRTRRVVLSP